MFTCGLRVSCRHCQCLSRLLHINNARASNPSLLYVTAPFSAANAVLPALNNAGANERHRELDAKLWARGCVEAVPRVDGRDGALGYGAGRRVAPCSRQPYARICYNQCKISITSLFSTQSCPSVGDDILTRRWR
ncbi:hypothetical protein GGX14DRAFT_573219 [Mycena pura]|uniref:Uncharacterized protein n=1 Tax=Mycena pura TaxID=153505 RepID=A0AAD6V259_9AGAR|nr:hypothetical protein GGX14DRAFT_573219 [Mycena pura]